MAGSRSARRDAGWPDHLCFSPDLNAAMGDALDTMLTWLQASYGVGKATALALASPVLDLRVTQVANQSWGIHALLPAGAIS